MPVLKRVRRKLSRTKSMPGDGNQSEPQPWPSNALSLTPSDEQLVSKLAFTPETEIIERTPDQQSPSIRTRRSERTVFNNVDSGILSLPTELLVFLQQYLAPSSEVALRHSCSRFFHLYRTASFLLAGKELFDFLCMTERDQDPTELDRLVCGKCQELHIRSTFPSSEVNQEPTSRDCRQIWLCAHRYLGYQKTIRTIKAGVESPFRVETLDPCSRCRISIRNRSVADRPEKGTSAIDLENPKSESLLISKIALLQAPSPLYNTRTSGGSGMYKEVFQVKDVSAALQAIDFQLCSHLKLGDPYILSKFCRACINTQRLPSGVKGPPCINESKREFGETRSGAKCKGTCYTRGCKTQFMFQARESLSPDISGRRQVWLIIVAYRWLGPLLTAGRDSTWSDHAVDHKERKEMRGKWAEWERANRTGRPCMPNWSICLLHPEDSNLR
ncbi:uncharacterized protein Z518_10933 [Rhinocladiella mackenziei CBS 650.93]|uniref:Rhinocladiella mackenziei CBS 650.93 unplaced genomic scaffold supercont1.10, whole genome shotgun sequence n=1 Tax=Rhinocladiella mackenziei CBS 650.93 TaxID=1442369 RepID=A0A0D2I9V3_9EURO|nr:uncharacterized protein Z518_10933 [Rhinocladiella mackenziei CBS 650.93]KIX00006.1 hypothetical protein Z518_10933 [Rhinocladiella mackenziei CBS 650.93]